MTLKRATKWPASYFNLLTVSFYINDLPDKGAAEGYPKIRCLPVRAMSKQDQDSASGSANMAKPMDNSRLLRPTSSCFICLLDV